MKSLLNEQWKKDINKAYNQIVENKNTEKDTIEKIKKYFGSESKIKSVVKKALKGRDYEDLSFNFEDNGSGGYYKINFWLADSTYGGVTPAGELHYVKVRIMLFLFFEDKLDIWAKTWINGKIKNWNPVNFKDNKSGNLKILKTYIESLLDEHPDTSHREDVR